VGGRVWGVAPEGLFSPGRIFGGMNGGGKKPLAGEGDFAAAAGRLNADSDFKLLRRLDFIRVHPCASVVNNGLQIWF
jgi:hypothetical protein